MERNDANRRYRNKPRLKASFTAARQTRWGVKVYEWTTLTGNWDGYVKSGTKAADGIYYYVVNTKDVFGKEHDYKGQINLLK